MNITLSKITDNKVIVPFESVSDKRQTIFNQDKGLTCLIKESNLPTDAFMREIDSHILSLLTNP